MSRILHFFRTHRRVWIVGIFSAALIVGSVFVFPALAQDRFGVNYGVGSGLSTQDIRATIANIVRYALGILGVVFLVIIIYGGVTWMTAGGDAARIERAKKIIINATIGLIIIFLAFAITSFVIRRLEIAAGGGGPPPGGGGPPPPGLPGSGFNVVSVNPQDLQQNVSLCAAVQAVFNADVEPATVNSSSVIIKPLSGSQVSGTYAVNANSFSFTHPEFAPNTTFEASVLTDVQNLAGDYLERSKVWTFTTGTESDTEPPTVVSTYPATGDTEICLGSPVQVVFSEEMLLSTLTPANVFLEAQDASGAWLPQVVVSVAPGNDFKSLSLFPAGPFTAQTQYRVTLRDAMTDTCGNLLDGDGDGIAGGDYDTSANGPWTFTTGDTLECTPYISSVAPAADYYSSQDIVVQGQYFFQGAGSDVMFNNFAADSNCFDPNFVPNTLCRVSWTPTQVVVKVPVGSTSGPLLVDVGGVRSNTVHFQILSPYIASLSPDNGPVGQYLTVHGKQFGNTPGRVKIGGIDATLPCANSWTDAVIVVEVPQGLTPGNYPVQVFTAAPGSHASNRLNFTVNLNPLTPGICSMVPMCGSSGTVVTFTGERFGNAQGASRVQFGSLNASVSAWANTSITVSAPIFPSNGVYPAGVTVNGLQSNLMPFATPCAPGSGQCGNLIIDPNEQCDGPVPPPPLSCDPPATGTWQCDANCNLFGCSGIGICGNNIVENGEQCDGTDLQGLNCTTYSGGSFTGGTLACTSSCTFDTSSCFSPADTPHIIEDPSCTYSLQSPSPYKDTQNACMNAKISVTFDRDMDEDTFQNIIIEACDTGSVFVLNCTTEVTGTVSAQTLAGGREAYVFTPNADFDPDRWYRVTVPVSVTSAAGVPLSAPYQWKFHVDTSGVSCTASTLMVTPPQATIATLGGTQDFTAAPVTANCNILTGSFAYSWNSSDPTRASVTGTSGATETATALASTGATPVQIISALRQNSSINGFGELSIYLGGAIPCQTSADCTPICAGSQCVNNICTPAVHSITPLQSPVGSWVTIAGCLFGDTQGSVTYTPGVLGLWPNPAICGPSTWSATQIISEIPNVQTVVTTDDAQTGPVTVTRGDGSETTYALGVLVGGTSHPNLCYLNPPSGSIGTLVTVRGNGFGQTRLPPDDVVTFGAQIAASSDYISWGPDTIEVLVPSGVTVGALPATVTKDGNTSNPLSFTVMGGGVNASCDNDQGTAMCDANDGLCNPGLFCDAASACTCQPAPAPSVVSTTPANGATNICRNTAVTVEFNQLMNYTSFGSDHVIVAGPNGCGMPVSLDSKGSLLSRGLNKLLTEMRTLITGEARAQIAPSGEDCIPFSLSFNDVDVNGNGMFENIIDHTMVTVTFNNPLNANTAYTVTFTTGIKNKYGVALPSDKVWSFTTGQIICQIDRVDITVRKGGSDTIPRLSNYDLYICAGRDDCPQDINAGVAGNQHEWTAQARDSFGNNLSATYQWTGNDPGNLFTLSAPGSNVTETTAVSAQQGTAEFRVSASGANMGSATSTITAEIDVCENPWPSVTTYPYTDSTGNCSGGGTCYDTDFSFWYCRDAGVTGTQDDLPALGVPPAVVGDQLDTLKEFLFLRADASDAIGLRVYKNPDQISLLDWYRQNATQPGNPGATTVDGFPALREERTTYVLAPKLLQGGSGGGFANIFVLSYSDNADQDTIAIYNNLIAHWKFIRQLAETDKPLVQRDLRRVTDLGSIAKYLNEYADAHRTCSNNPAQACTEDANCCIDQSCASFGTCSPSYPSLASGSYIIGNSTSKWPSWQATLGNALGKALPVDPLNTFPPPQCSAGARAGQACALDGDCFVCQTTTSMTCASDSDCPSGETCVKDSVYCSIAGCPAPGFDQTSCWNQSTKTFVCPVESYLYMYRSSGAGFQLGTHMEYAGGWSGGSALAPCVNYSIAGGQSGAP